MTTPIFVSVRGAAELLGVSESTIWRMLADHQITATRIRGARRIRISELQAFRGTPEVIVSISQARKARRTSVDDLPPLPSGVKMPLEQYR